MIIRILSAAIAALVMMEGTTWAAADTSSSLTAIESQIEAITGLKGTRNEAEGVFKVSAPRTDVKASVDGQPFPPFMGLTSWAAFKAGSKEAAMVMGDLVLLQDEVNPVMSALFDAGLDVTALHNHFFFDEPKVYFLHIGGEGDAEKLARGVRAALDKAKAVRAENGVAPAKSFGQITELPTSSSITTAKVDTVLKTKGQVKDGMYKAVFGRTVKMPCGCEVGKEMGTNTWAALMGSDENAIIDGDFVTFPGELQPVLRALRKADINVVAIHNHMEGESPRTIFLHYWGRGPAERLAAGVKSALDAQSAVQSNTGSAKP